MSDMEMFQQLSSFAGKGSAPCLHIVSVDPPRVECPHCRERFAISSDSLRAVLAEFRQHVARKHRPAKEDFSQAAARIVREATE